MGGNVSRTTEDCTVAAYTLYGFGCSRGKNPPTFLPGAPRNTCCGTSMGAIYFDQTFPEVEQGLSEAADLAMQHVTWCSHICCAGVDMTSESAAQVINQEWCPRYNEMLEKRNLRIHAAREVFGFGRSRVTYLVIRILPSSTTGSTSNT